MVLQLLGWYWGTASAVNNFLVFFSQKTLKTGCCLEDPELKSKAASCFVGRFMFGASTMLSDKVSSVYNSESCQAAKKSWAQNEKKAHTLCVIFFSPSKFCVDFIKLSQDRKSQQIRRVRSDTQVFCRNVSSMPFSSSPLPCVVSLLTGFDVSVFFGTGYQTQQRVCSVRWDTPKLPQLKDLWNWAGREIGVFWCKWSRHSYLKMSWALILGRFFFITWVCHRFCKWLGALTTGYLASNTF